MQWKKQHSDRATFVEHLLKNKLWHYDKPNTTTLPFGHSDFREDTQGGYALS
jgi:hypothetical protein